MTTRLVLIICVLTLILPTAYSRRSHSPFSHLQPNHREVLKKWLVKRAWLQPATEDDFGDKEGLAYLRSEIGRNVHPYYAVGDFNDDGRKDFAVILFRRGKEEAALAVFNAPFKRNAPAYFETGFYRHGRMYIAYDYMAEKRLFLGVLEGDFYCTTFIPRGRKYVYRTCEH